MSGWSEGARQAIHNAHATVPKGATLKERMAIIDAAYPFDARENWPYKAWLTARTNYLRPYGYRPKPKAPTPLFDCSCGVHSSVPHKAGCPMFVSKEANKK